MTLDQLGAWFLPRLHAVAEWAVDVTLGFELYVARWREALDV